MTRLLLKLVSWMLGPQKVLYVWDLRTIDYVSLRELRDLTNLENRLTLRKIG